MFVRQLIPKLAHSSASWLATCSPTPSRHVMTIEVLYIIVVRHPNGHNIVPYPPRKTIRATTYEHTRFTTPQQLTHWHREQIPPESHPTHHIPKPHNNVQRLIQQNKPRWHNRRPSAQSLIASTPTQARAFLTTRRQLRKRTHKSNIRWSRRWYPWQSLRDTVRL